MIAISFGLMDYLHRHYVSEWHYVSEVIKLSLVAHM